jgi:ferredoxin
VSPEVFVDRIVCIGSGSCVHLAPGVFELDAEGVAEVVDPSAADPAVLRRAARSCPTQAIEVDDSGDGGDPA